MALDDQPDDEELAIRMMDKDQSALTEVLRLYGPKVKGFLKSKYKNLNKLERDEAFNRAAFNVWRFADRYDASKGSFSSWFTRIADRAALSLIRGEKKHLAVDLEYDPSYDPADDDEDVPDVDSKEHKLLEALHHFIYEELTGFEQVVAVNDFIAGGEADSGRLASLHGKSMNTVYATRSKVKKKITEWLTKTESRPQGGKVKA